VGARTAPTETRMVYSDELAIHRDADSITVESLASASNMTLIEILLELSRRIANAIRKHLLTTAVRDAIGVYRDTLIASTIDEVSNVLDLEQSASLAAGHLIAIDEIADKRVKSIRHIIYLHKNTPSIISQDWGLPCDIPFIIY